MYLPFLAIYRFGNECSSAFQPHFAYYFKYATVASTLKINCTNKDLTLIYLVSLRWFVFTLQF